MDPNTSIGRLCLGENNQGSVAEGIENKEQWEGPEFQDTASSEQKREAKVFTFYRIKEEGERYFTPCYVGELHAYDGEINLKYEKNLISNEFAVKLLVNPEEDDVELSVILGRLFMRLTKGIADLGNGIITIHLELDPFLDNFEEIEKFEDDWDHLLDIDFGDILEIDEAGLPPFVCKKGKRKRNKKRALEKAAREALSIDICKSFSILEEERPMIDTMEYSDKYKKIMDGIVRDKLKLDGEIKKEEEEVIKQVKGEALKEKEDPRAFVILIGLEAQIDLNAFTDTGSDINVMPF
nr:hypothetical protein [Tanacetum cinerariifolium]